MALAGIILISISVTCRQIIEYALIQRTMLTMISECCNHSKLQQISIALSVKHKTVSKFDSYLIYQPKNVLYNWQIQ